MNFNDNERDLYEDQLKWLGIEDNSLKKTREEVFAEGIEKGKTERDIEITKNLLKLGLSIDVIAESTGLSARQIEELKSS